MQSASALDDNAPWNGRTLHQEIFSKEVSLSESRDRPTKHAEPKLDKSEWTKVGKWGQKKYKTMLERKEKRESVMKEGSLAQLWLPKVTRGPRYKYLRKGKTGK